MSHGFVTELLSEKPQVIVVAESGLVTQQFSQALADLHLAPIILSAAVLKTKSGLLDQAYKIVWLAPWLGGNSRHQLEMLATLKPHQAKTMVVTTLDTGTVDSRPLLSIWFKKTADQTITLNTIATELPRASFVIGIDVLNPFNPAENGVLAFMTSVLAAGQWWDPEVEFFPQTWESFSQNLSHFLVPPGQEKRLIRGKKLSTTSLVKLLQLHFQRLTGLVAQINQAAAQSAELPKLPLITTVSVESSEMLLHTILPALNQFKIKIPDVFIAPLAAAPVPQALETPKIKPQPASPPPLVAQKKTQTSSEKMPTKTANAEKKLLMEAPKSLPFLGKQAVVSPPKVIKNQVLPSQELDDQLAKLFSTYRSGQKVQQVTEVAKVTTVTKKKSLRKKKVFWAGLVMISAALVLAGSLGVLSVTASHLRQSLIAHAASTPLELFATPNFLFWHRLAKLHQQSLSFLPGIQIEETGQLVQVSDSLLKFQDSSRLLRQTSLNLVLAMTGRYPAGVDSLLTKLGTQSQTTFANLSEAQLYLRELTEFQSETEKKNLAVLDAVLNDQKKVFVPWQQLQPLLPTILGLEGKKTYALLFQNHQELRPMGGTTQAVAFITFDKGFIVDTEVSSALTATTSGSPLAAPADLAKLLGTKDLRLQDSSWSPDAPTSADQTIDFLEQTTSKNIDGVFFVNTLSLNEWLKVVGPLDMPEYNEVITDKNLWERLESHSGIQVPGTAKADFPTLVLTKLLQKTLNTPEEKILPLLTFLFQQLESKQLVLVAGQEDVSALFRSLGWSGNLLEPACPSPLQQERCQVDVVAQVESNIGANKANIYLERTVAHQVFLGAEEVQHVHSITFSNRATSNAWPRGSYKAYIRLYVPATARLVGVKIDGQNLPSDQTVIAFENNRQVFGATIEVPIQSQLTLEYDYFLPNQQQVPFSYALFTQFQPGISVPQYQVKLDPGQYKPTVLAPQATLDGSIATFKSPDALQSLVGVRFD